MQVDVAGFRAADIVVGEAETGTHVATSAAVERAVRSHATRFRICEQSALQAVHVATPTGQAASVVVLPSSHASTPAWSIPSPQRAERHSIVARVGVVGVAVVAFFDTDAQEAVAASREPATAEAGVEVVGVAVIALFHSRSEDAVTAGGKPATGRAGIGVHAVAVVAWLARIDDAVPAAQRLPIADVRGRGDFDVIEESFGSCRDRKTI